MILALVGLAQAQDTPTLNAQLFSPSVDAQQTFWLEDAVVSEKGTLSTGALLQWLNAPFAMIDETGERTVLVDDVFQLDLLGGYSFGRARVGLDVPLYLRSVGGAVGGETGLGDVFAGAKVAVVDGSDAPFGVAVAGGLGLPTSTVDTSLGSDGVTWKAHAIVDKHVGELVVLANLGLRGQPTVELDNVTVDDQLFYGLGGSYTLSDATGLSAELAGHARPGAGDAAGHPLEGLFGGWFRPGGGDLLVRTGVGIGLSEGIGAPRTRVVAALAYAPVDRDTDGDGLLDDEDACPTYAEDMDSWEDEDGCPEPTQVALLAVDEAGWPIEAASYTVSGKPSDGVLSLEAGTHLVMANAPGYAAHQGPHEVLAGPPMEIKVTLEALLATLHVKVVDKEGAPVDAAVVVGDQILQTEGGELTTNLAPGPVEITAQAEGYLDGAAAVEVLVDQAGEVELVLEKALVEVVAERIELKEAVYFELAKAVIKEESHAMLGQVARVLGEHPEITLVRVEGHTDSRGGSAANQRLSEQRAAAVLDFLVENGVEPERLESEGYGESRPLDKRENEEAWAKNRRVDLFIAERADASEAD